jgi:hypothetical protein
MRYLLFSIILLFTQSFSYSQYNYKIYNTLNEKPKIENTYLNIYPKKIDYNQKTTLFDFNFRPLNINQIQSDSTYDIKSIFNYGLGFDYNYDLNNNEMIDLSLIIDTRMSNLNLNFIRFSIIFYF